MTFLEHRFKYFEATFKQNLEYIYKFQPITTFVAHGLINSHPPFKKIIK